jgi:hypothetical protein
LQTCQGVTGNEDRLSHCALLAEFGRAMRQKVMETVGLLADRQRRRLVPNPLIRTSFATKIESG